MNKEDQTRDLIIQTSLKLFNKKGYDQTSIQDIMNATALPKGSIYRRFENKNDISIASFKYSMSIIWQHYFEAIKSKFTATDKIIAMLKFIKMLFIPPLLMVVVHYGFDSKTNG